MASDSGATFAVQHALSGLYGNDASASVPAGMPAIPPDLADWQPKRYGYRVGSLCFLVGERTRSEVVRSPVISPLPHSPQWLLGLMNLRGNLVPVADLRALCGEPPDSRAPAMVLVIDAGEKAVAIPVSALPQPLAELQETPTTPCLPDSLAVHAGPAFESEGQTWLAFDHEGFFRTLTREPHTHL